MACRSCGIGPKKIKKFPPKIDNDSISRSHPSKGVIENTQKKTSVPTRSPARTFKTLGEN